LFSSIRLLRRSSPSIEEGGKKFLSCWSCPVRGEREKKSLLPRTFTSRQFTLFFIMAKKKGPRLLPREKNFISASQGMTSFSSGDQSRGKKNLLRATIKRKSTNPRGCGRRKKKGGFRSARGEGSSHDRINVLPTISSF